MPANWLPHEVRTSLFGPNGKTNMTIPISVTIPKAVELSGLSRSRIYEALKSKSLVAKKAGRRTLIPVAELETYLASLPSYGEGE